MDGRRARGVGASAYKQWVEHWRDSLASERVRDYRRKRLVERNAPEFLEALASASKGNFLLAPGGECVANIAGPQDLDSITDELYRFLVTLESAPASTRDKPAEGLRLASERALKRAGLLNHLLFQRDYQVCAPLGGGATEPFQFHYACVNGEPQALLDRVLFPDNPAKARERADAIAWKFEKTSRAANVSAENMVALVALSEEEEAEANTRTRLATLGSVGRVVNARDVARAAKLLAPLRRAA